MTIGELKHTLTGDGRWIPLLFVGFFLVVFAANGAMVAVAVSTWTGVTTDRHYRDGVEYNRRLDAAARQAALGWRLDIASEDAGPSRLDFSVGVSDREGGAVAPDQVSVLFWRPTSQGFDRPVALQPAGDGRFAATVELPVAGLWDARITVTRGAERYQTVKRLFVEP